MLKPSPLLVELLLLKVGLTNSQGLSLSIDPSLIGRETSLQFVVRSLASHRMTSPTLKNILTKNVKFEKLIFRNFFIEIRPRLLFLSIYYFNIKKV